MKACLLVVSFLLLGYLCRGQKNARCPKSRIAVGDGKSGLRELRFIIPQTNGNRVSRCFGKGAPLCLAEETQEVADAFCLGVGYQFAFFWRAVSMNDTACSPRVESVEGNVCNNKKLKGRCQGFERITCAGPKYIDGILEAGKGFGVFSLSQNGRHASVLVNMTFAGLPPVELEVSMHEGVINGSCDSLGPEITCAAIPGCGNLSRRHGVVRGPRVQVTFEDTQTTLFGPHAADGRTLVLTDKRGKRVACGTLRTVASIVLPDNIRADIREIEARAALLRTQALLSSPSSSLRKETVSKRPSRGDKPSPRQFISPPPGNNPAPDTQQTVTESAPPPPTAPIITSTGPFHVTLPTTQRPESPIGAREAVTRCPPGMSCHQRKCRTDCDNLETCCHCQKWFADDGSCTPDGWSKILGPGHCDFNNDCPPGVKCDSIKRLRSFTGVRVDETCCECVAHNIDGTCKTNGYQVLRGTGDCNFEVPVATVSQRGGTGARPQGE